MTAEELTKPQLCIEQRGPDVVVQVPANLGGGQIIEEDYRISTHQARTVMYILNLGHIDMESYASTIEAIEEQSEDSEQQPVSSLEELWQEKDALRIIRPVFTVIQTKLDLEREVSPIEEFTLYTFRRAETSNDDAIRKYETDPDSIDKLAYEMEIAKKRAAKQTELRRRKNAGILYDDGSVDSPAVQRRRQRRREHVLDGHIFTPEYRASKMGSITLELLGGERIAEDDRNSEITAVACLDARSAGREVMSPEEYEDLKARANVRLSNSSHWIAATERRMQSKTARARLTTGDGVPIVSRPKPGM